MPLRTDFAHGGISAQDNFSRGWWGLSLKTAEELELSRLPKDKYEVLFPKQDEQRVDEMEEDQEQEEAGEDPLPKGSETRLVFPWEAREGFWRTLIGAFAPESLTILDASPSTFLPLACCRHKVGYKGWVQTEGHKQYILESLCLAILMERISAKNDGFGSRKRVLSRQASLTGEPDPKKPKEEIKPPVGVGAAPKAESEGGSDGEVLSETENEAAS